MQSRLLRFEQFHRGTLHRRCDHACRSSPGSSLQAKCSGCFAASLAAIANACSGCPFGFTANTCDAAARKADPSSFPPFCKAANCSRPNLTTCVARLKSSFAGVALQFANFVDCRFCLLKKRTSPVSDYAGEIRTVRSVAVSKRWRSIRGRYLLNRKSVGCPIFIAGLVLIDRIVRYGAEEAGLDFKTSATSEMKSGSCCRSSLRSRDLFHVSYMTSRGGSPRSGENHPTSVGCKCPREATVEDVPADTREVGRGMRFQPLVDPGWFAIAQDLDRGGLKSPRC